MSKGKNHLYLYILKIGVKNPDEILDPYITVSLKDRQGVDLCDVQNTPIATIKEGNSILFNNNIVIPMSVEKIPPVQNLGCNMIDAAVFFELRHIKVKKKSTSVKCFAFIDKTQMKDGRLCIELYKKPVDYKRKKLSLLTTKPIFLHLDLTII